MAESESQEQFVRQLTEHQNRIYGYVYSLLGDHSRAADVVQEINLVLWRKANQFRPDKPFLPWAFAIARFQVLACLRDQKRDRLLLDAELVEVMSRDVEQQAEQFDVLRSGLRRCLQLLASDHRDLIEQHYYHAKPLSDIADSVDRTVGSIKVALLRIRRQLADCVQKRLAAEK